MNRISSFLPALAVLGAIISLCVGASYAKQIFGQVGPEGATTYRVGFAALILVGFWRPWRFKLSKSDFFAVARFGLILGSMNLMFYKAISTIPLGIAIAIEFTGPLAVAMFSSRKKLDFLWIAFVIFGLALLLPWHQGSDNLDPVGVCFVLGAATCWALYIIYGKQAGKIHLGQSTALSMSVASLVVLPFGIARSGTALLAPDLMVFGFVVALLSSALPYSLEMYALKKLPKQTFAILLSLEPVVGAVSALIILHEALSPTQWFAISSIIIASVGSTATSGQSQVAEIPEIPEVPEDQEALDAQPEGTQTAPVSQAADPARKASGA
jgi:inner membrane transporter RhtA